MALFGIGKNKKKPVASAPGLPIDQVTVLKQRGMDNSQIISELEKQGYNSSQIFDAMNKMNVNNPGIDTPPELDIPPPPNFQNLQAAPQPTPQFDAPLEQEQVNKEEIEEIAEAIIDEKWKEFEQDVKVIIDWKQKTETKIDKIEQQIKDLSNNLDNLHSSIIGKISKYDSNITNVGTEIKAMEKVFQKVLPSLTENVNKLDRIAKGSKSTKK